VSVIDEWTSTERLRNNNDKGKKVPLEEAPVPLSCCPQQTPHAPSMIEPRPRWLTVCVIVRATGVAVVTQAPQVHHTIFFFMKPQPILARDSSLSRLHSHTQQHHTIYDSSGRIISPVQRSQPDNTQHSKETDVHAPGGIRTRNPCHWYRPTYWQYNYVLPI
jgi:hypothetical protein